MVPELHSSGPTIKSKLDEKKPYLPTSVLHKDSLVSVIE